MFTKSDKCDIIFLLYMTRGDCMIKKEMIAMLLAGGQGSRLGVLPRKLPNRRWHLEENIGLSIFR